MATKAIKKLYSIGLVGPGYWAGKCPQCEYTVEANDWSVPQAAVILTIQRHEESEHA